jgi:hypothetical protein
LFQLARFTLAMIFDMLIAAVDRQTTIRSNRTYERRFFPASLRRSIIATMIASQKFHAAST